GPRCQTARPGLGIDASGTFRTLPLLPKPSHLFHGDTPVRPVLPERSVGRSPGQRSWTVRVLCALTPVLRGLGAPTPVPAGGGRWNGGGVRAGGVTGPGGVAGRGGGRWRLVRRPGRGWRGCPARRGGGRRPSRRSRRPRTPPPGWPEHRC